MIKLLLLIWLLFTRPAWALQWIRASPYYSSHFKKRHVKRLRDYAQYEFRLVDVLQRACATSRERVNYVLNESRELLVNRESKGSVIPEEYNASEELAQLCYSIVRLTKPSTIVETGVGRGVTSNYILRALEENGKGQLYSIDLPTLRLGARKDVGKLVPMSLRSRWKLIFGPGVLEMKKLRNKLKNIDMFVHDSDHSYFNQLAEYQIALDWLKKGGILVSDDVGNDALIEASEKFNGELVVIKQDKPQYIGIIIK